MEVERVVKSYIWLWQQACKFTDGLIFESETTKRIRVYVQFKVIALFMDGKASMNDLLWKVTLYPMGS